MYAKCQKVSLTGAVVFKNVTKTYDNSLRGRRRRRPLKTHIRGLTVRTTIQTDTEVGCIDLTYKCEIYVT